MDLIARELYDFYGSTDSWEIYNDAVAFLKALKESHPGVKTGMITNFDRRILSLLEQFGISDLIDVKVNTKSTYLRKAFLVRGTKTQECRNCKNNSNKKVPFSGISVSNKLLRDTPRFFTTLLLVLSYKPIISNIIFL